MTFHVGQKVVCVDASNAALGIRVPLVEGHVYTIAGFDDAPGERCASLTEVAGNVFLTGFFYLRRFRPAVERKTDISIFTKMLTPKRKEMALSSTD